MTSWYGHALRITGLCVGNQMCRVDFPHKGSEMLVCDVSFVVISKKPSNKQSSCRWKGYWFCLVSRIRRKGRIWLNFCKSEIVFLKSTNFSGSWNGFHTSFRMCQYLKLREKKINMIVMHKYALHQLESKPVNWPYLFEWHFRIGEHAFAITHEVQSLIYHRFIIIGITDFDHLGSPFDKCFMRNMITASKFHIAY